MEANEVLTSRQQDFPALKMLNTPAGFWMQKRGGTQPDIMRSK